MTVDQFNNIFATHSYAEARSIIREEIKRMGKSTGANDTKIQLMQKVVDGIPYVETDQKSDVERGEREPTPPEMPSPDGGVPNPSDGTPKEGTPIPIPGLEGDGKSEPKSEDTDDALTKAIKAAEEEARKREEEAKRQRDAADTLKKKLEEMRRKAEEARKKKEKEEADKAKKKEHYKTDELVETLKICGQAYLVGPAGTGKSTLAMDACCKMFKVDKSNPDEFSKVFAQISFSPDTTKGEMIGMTDVNGVFHESEIVRVFRDGGIILFDEMDNADASMLVKLNTALANGFIATPKGQVKRNANTYIICTANTFGIGPDAMYVGRTRLDAATLDRFTLCTIEVDYDTKLEQCIMNPLSKENQEWLTAFVKKCRKVIKDNKFRRLCTTRMVINATKFLAQGKDTKFVEDRFMLGWSPNEANALRAAS